MQRKIKELELASAGILARVLHDVSDDVNGFSAVAKSKYFSKRIAVEEDSNRPYLAITFTFLQEEENYRESLDSEVLEAVKNSLESHKFSDKVKDVVVNLSQARDANLEF